MFSQPDEAFHRRLRTRLWRASIALVLFLACATVTARAQGFVSGSTGADGPFDPPSQVPPGTQVQGNCSSGPCTVIVPLRNEPNDVFNFTTINIASNVTVTFVRNASNTPVSMLATGNVTIVGTIDLRGGNNNGQLGGAGGPGGGKGGAGGFDVVGYSLGLTGDGPGGGGRDGGGAGHAMAGGGVNGGPAYGTGTLLPLLGGSGGGGESGVINSRNGNGGGGGGGAILIASSGTIAGVNFAHIYVFGGDGHSGGSGGGIRLVANIVTGSLSFQANGGPRGSPGFYRVEAFDRSNLVLGLGPADPGLFSFGLPQSAIPPNLPRLRITSIAGIPAPTTPGGSLQGTPDIVVPQSQPNPVTVAIEGANIPVGTVVYVTLTAENADIGRTTVQSTPLAGTDANSTATAQVTLPPGGNSVITATVTINFNPLRPIKGANLRPFFIDGERVDSIEVAAVYGGTSEVIYVTRSGKHIKRTAQ